MKIKPKAIDTAEFVRDNSFEFTIIRIAQKYHPQPARNGKGKSYCYGLARRHPNSSGEPFV